MTSIQILPVEEINSISSVYIQNIFIDIQNKTITIEVDKVGQIVSKETLIASGEDYSKIYKDDLLNDFVLASLGFTVRT
jgi:hypothetical protein